MFNKNFNKIKIIFLLIIFYSLVVSCNIYKPTNAREIPSSGIERARKNIEEGRGFSLKNLSNKDTTYQFATSNPLWRASLEILNFIPLTTVDYSGGIIITDWYSDSLNTKESLKITIHFLSNEIRSDSVMILIHKKTCSQENYCSTSKINSKINKELLASILKKASILDKEAKEKK